MPAYFNDPLWPDFAPLWISLKAAANGKPIMVAGGYGLFLKQAYLQQTSTRVIIPFNQWGVTNQAPRTTKDIDAIVDLEIIADQKLNEACYQSISDLGYALGPKLSDQRWKFRKRTGEEAGNEIILELHAPIPAVPDKKDNGKLEFGKNCVKHKPSLKGKGVHGRRNPEAVGCFLHPYEFTVQNALQALNVLVPDPITWCVMKMTAAEDHFNQWQSATDSEEIAFYQTQAEKHAQDVFRIVAMTTQGESDNAVPAVIASLQNSPAYTKSSEIRQRRFISGGLGAVAARQHWLSGDMDILLGILTDWFP